MLCSDVPKLGSIVLLSRSLGSEIGKESSLEVDLGKQYSERRKTQHFQIYCQFPTWVLVGLKIGNQFC